MSDHSFSVDRIILKAMFIRWVS